MEQSSLINKRINRKWTNLDPSADYLGSSMFLVFFLNSVSTLLDSILAPFDSFCFILALKITFGGARDSPENKSRTKHAGAAKSRAKEP